MSTKKVYGKSDMTMGETTLLWDYEDTLCGTGHLRFLYLSNATGHYGTSTIRRWFCLTVYDWHNFFLVNAELVKCQGLYIYLLLLCKKCLKTVSIKKGD